MPSIDNWYPFHIPRDEFSKGVRSVSDSKIYLKCRLAVGTLISIGDVSVKSER